MQALWMLAASFFFATMAVCVKYASAWFGAAELVFYRGLIGMGLMFGFIGVLLAAPLTIVVFVLVQRIYVQTLLGRDITVATDKEEE